jgi:hypothetical protein
MDFEQNKDGVYTRAKILASRSKCHHDFILKTSLLKFHNRFLLRL